jgi:hypothetical protein
MATAAVVAISILRMCANLLFWQILNGDRPRGVRGGRMKLT